MQSLPDGLRESDVVGPRGEGRGAWWVEAGGQDDRDECLEEASTVTTAGMGVQGSLILRYSRYQEELFWLRGAR